MCWSEKPEMSGALPAIRAIFETDASMGFDSLW